MKQTNPSKTMLKTQHWIHKYIDIEKPDLKMLSSTIEKFVGGTNTMSLSSSSTISSISLLSYSTHMTKSKDHIDCCGSCGGCF